MASTDLTDAVADQGQESVVGFDDVAVDVEEIVAKVASSAWILAPAELNERNPRSIEVP